MIPFGTTHGKAFDRHVSRRGNQTVIVTEIVTVQYGDGSRPSTAIMEDAYFQVIERDGKAVLTQRIVSDIPVRVLTAPGRAKVHIGLNMDKTEVIVSVGSDVEVEANVVTPFKPVASDSRTA